MLMTERCRFSCMELQYLLWAEEAEPFLSRLELRAKGTRLRGDQWRISTVYLDRPDGVLAAGALVCPELRSELRLREFFSPAGATLSPFVWVELKGTEKPLSWLNRFQLHRGLIPRFLRGDLKASEILERQEPFVERDRVRDAVSAVKEVAGSGPWVVVGATSFLRQALEGGTPEARLTVDREVTYHRSPASLRGPEPSLERGVLGPLILEEPSAVVEIKVRGSRRPAWCDRLPEPAAGPVDYSKFLVLAALLRSNREVRRNLGRRRAQSYG